jgi:hypothetical protein
MEIPRFFTTNLRAFKRVSLTLFCLLSIATHPVAATASDRDAPPEEPNFEMAKQWWPELTDFWTPVGWKHHRFRYNVFFDGTILADPSLSQTAKEWKGQGVQLRASVRVGGAIDNNDSALDKLRSERYVLEDDRRSLQGWTTNAAPVLWTEWSANGVLLRQHVFAHIPGGGDVKTGLEPLFLWVRLSVHDICPGLPVPPRYTFGIQINAPHVTTSMSLRKNITMHPDRATYPRALKASSPTYDGATGLRIMEPDGKVRLAIAPGAKAETGFLEADDSEKAQKDPLLHITLDAKPAQFVDVLVPMIPTDPAVVDAELALGYDKALAAADQFWSKRPATAAQIDVPEPYINDAIRQFERFAEVLSERNPETGRNMTLSGSLAYVRVWATPTGKMVSMLLDPMGYHDLAAEYLEPFIAAQGTRKPPSSFLEKHPGFLGSPEEFKSIDWMADHGSLLFAIANHALLIDEDKAKERYVEPILKACEFIHYARRVKGHKGVEGILPPARYSDAAAQTQGVWSDGWNFKGLATAGRFLRQINHPRAAEFTAEAEDYKKTFLAAFREAASKTDTWTDDKGKVHQFIPTSLFGAVEVSSRHPFYLDTGPMQLVFAGLMDADDPLMQSALAWFREGPVQRFARHNSNYMQVGFLVHEMSNCIPGYSWNLFHNHRLADRQHFLEGMYSQYAGAISRQTMTVCETRGGITGRITHADTPFYMTRLAVVDDQITEGELHLLRLCPVAWISKDRETKFENMPTEFGPVTLRWQLSDDGEKLRVTYEAKLHAKPRGVFLHVPPMPGLKTISVNGKNVAAEAGAKLPL